MNTIQKLVTIGEDNSLLWHQKGHWVSPSGNTITIDPDKGIDRNGVPIDSGGSAPIPPILTPEKIVINDNAKHVEISGQGGVVVSSDSGRSTTINDTGVKVSTGGTLAIGSATLGGPLLSMLQGTHDTATGNLSLGTTKSLAIGDQSLTRSSLIALNVGIPTHLGTLEAEVGTLTPLKGRVTSLEATTASHETRISALETADGTFDSRLGVVESGLDAEVARVTTLSGRVYNNEAVANAGIATLTDSVNVLDGDVQFLTSRLTAAEGVAGDATTAAAAANTAAVAAQGAAVTAQGTADTALATANAALGTATNAETTAAAANTAAIAAQGTAATAQTTANTAQGTADAALAGANSAQTDATTALANAATAQTAANAAQGTAATAQTAANAAQGTADTAQGTADTAKTTADSALATANSAQSAANSAQSAAQAAETLATNASITATAAQTTANTARDDIVIMKGIDVSLAERITTLENGSGGQPVVLPFYAKTDKIDFGTGNTTISNNEIKIGPSGTLSMGGGATGLFGDNTAITAGAGFALSTGTGSSISMGTGSSISMGTGNSISLSSTGALALGSEGTIAVGQTTLNKSGKLSLGPGGEVNAGTAGTFLAGENGGVVLGVGGTVRIDSTITDEEGLKACNRLAAMTQITPTTNEKVVLYNAAGAGSMGYSDLPLTSFTNPTWVEANRAFFPDAVLGDTSFQKSSLVLDGSTLGKVGVDAVNSLVAAPPIPFDPALAVLSKDANGVINKSLLPNYITPGGIDFGGGATIGTVQATTLGNLAALPGDGASSDYVVYNTTTKEYGYQPKPSFVDTVNKVVGNMGGTGDATEAYLGKQGVTFGSATAFEPLENTCYASNAVTVVDRTQGTVGQRKRAAFGANGIVLSNPLATSLDDPSTITLDRAKLALLQRIAAIDVMTAPDVAATSTKRFLVGDKVSGGYSYALAPEIPNYVKPGLVDFTVGSLRTTMDQTGIDVTDTTGNTAAELTSTALTLGDTGGNASLGKAGIEAANNLKDAIAGAVTTTVSGNQSVLIYDATTAKVSKSNTFLLRDTPTVQAMLSPISLAMNNGNEYSFINFAGVTTYVPSSNALSTLRGNSLTLGTRSAGGNINGTLPNVQLEPTNLKLFDGTTTHTLDAPAIKAAANLATVATTTPSTENKMVVYNPTTSVYAYHDAPAEVTLPDYVKPTLVDFTDGSLRTAVDQIGIEVTNTTGNTTSELTSTALTIGDAGGSASLVKAGIQAANNLKDAIAGAVTDIANDDQSVLIYDEATANVSKANTFRLRDSGSIFATHTPSTITVQSGADYSTLGYNGVHTYREALNALSILGGNTLTIGSHSASGNIDSNLPYTELRRTSLRFYDGTTNHTLTAPTIAAASNLATVATTTPSTENKMVVYNPTTKVYAYHDAPNLPGTIYKATLTNNLANSSGAALGVYNGTTVSYSSTNYTTFGGLKRISDPIKPGDCLVISMGNGSSAVSGRTYYLPFALNVATANTYFTATSELGPARCVIANVDTSTTTFTNCVVVIIRSIQAMTLSLVKIDLVCHSIDTPPTTCTVTNA